MVPAGSRTASSGSRSALRPRRTAEFQCPEGNRQPLISPNQRAHVSETSCLKRSVLAHSQASKKMSLYIPRTRQHTKPTDVCLSSDPSHPSKHTASSQPSRDKAWCRKQWVLSSIPSTMRKRGIYYAFPDLFPSTSRSINPLLRISHSILSLNPTVPPINQSTHNHILLNLNSLKPSKKRCISSNPSSS